MKTIHDVISEKEEIELKKLADNETAMKALKKVLLFDVYDSGRLKPEVDPDPTKNFCLSFLYDPTTGQEYRINDKELGEKLRASLEGIRMVQSAFNTLERINKQEQEKDKESNPAR